MNTIVKTAVFPIYPDTIDVVRYITKFRADIKITELLSMPGSGICGKDASYIDNREPIGFIVNPYSNAQFEKWEQLMILQHETLGLTSAENYNTIYKPIIDIAYAKSKTITMTNEIHKLSMSGDLDIEKNNDSCFATSTKRFAVLHPTKVYTIFIGGILAEANSFEVFLNLYGELSKVLKISAFSSALNSSVCGVHDIHNLLYNRSYSETDKIYMLHDLIEQEYKKAHSKVVLIHLAESLMPFSDHYTSGFGVIPYLALQAIQPDYSICCLPIDYVNPSFIFDIEADINKRFGFSVEKWHVSNVIMDHLVAEEIQDASMLYVPVEEVDTTILEVSNAMNNVKNLINRTALAETRNEILVDYKLRLSLQSII